MKPMDLAAKKAWFGAASHWNWLRNRVGQSVYSRGVSRQKVSNLRMIKTTNGANSHKSREAFHKVLAGFRGKGVA